MAVDSSFDTTEKKQLVKEKQLENKSEKGKQSLENAIVQIMTKHKMTLSAAESCTGGMLSAKVINVPGASAVYEAGFVTYANKAKHKLIGVKNKTLQKYGAVSKETAEEMVKGTLKASGADYAVAITGIAGPDGGSEEKPVGLVYIACHVCGVTTVKEYHFSGNRNKIRENTVARALIQARDCVMDYYN